MDDTLEDQGFLSREMDNVVSRVHAKYKPWLDLIREENNFAVDAQYSISIHRDDIQETLVALLFVRTLSNVQAGVILLERGMEVQASVILRAATESLFSLAAISRSRDVAEMFVGADGYECNRMFNKIKQWRSGDNSAHDAIDAKIAAIERTIDKTNAKKMSAEEMSKKAGLHELYLTSYSFLSAAVHPNVRDLKRHHVVMENGDIQAIKNEPVVDDLAWLWLIAAELLLYAVKATGDIFPIVGVKEFYEEHQRTLNELAKTLKDM